MGPEGVEVGRLVVRGWRSGRVRRERMDYQVALLQSFKCPCLNNGMLLLWT